MSRLRVTVVAGLPGSGKTTWARTQVGMDSKSALVDDFTVDPGAWEAADPSEHDHIYLADPHLMVATPEQVAVLLDRQWGLGPDEYHMEWVCLPNDPERCLARVGPDLEGIIESLSRSHIFPPFAQHLPWQGPQASRARRP